MQAAIGIQGEDWYSRVDRAALPYRSLRMHMGTSGGANHALVLALDAMLDYTQNSLHYAVQAVVSSQ